jgi:hypothetical protein
VNIGLVRFAMDCGGAWHRNFSDARIFRSALSIPFEWLAASDVFQIASRW